jgi:hypothetical protein
MCIGQTTFEHGMMRAGPARPTGKICWNMRPLLRPVQARV